ncbi:MAG: hypothetical protein E7019_06385 [Alphaproteobacteria bacterium]|nr:hypothetical protein [Alphaproteobacteria bacterium]
MAFTQYQLQQKANSLFTYFETHYFQNSLSYSKRVNLVLEFCDYIDNLQEWELLDLLESQDYNDAYNFRTTINQGADKWLGDLIKTISY